MDLSVRKINYKHLLLQGTRNAYIIIYGTPSTSVFEEMKSFVQLSRGRLPHMSHDKTCSTNKSMEAKETICSQPPNSATLGRRTNNKEFRRRHKWCGGGYQETRPCHSASHPKGTRRAQNEASDVVCLHTGHEDECQTAKSLRPVVHLRPEWRCKGAAPCVTPLGARFFGQNNKSMSLHVS